MNKKLLSKLIGMSKSEIEDLIDQRVICRRKAERNREILKMALIDGITQEKIAEKHGLTPRQVQNIIYETEKILLKYL
jgi:23S rRNA-/tRNA-specific pseudouridylate synthase